MELLQMDFCQPLPEQIIDGERILRDTRESKLLSLVSLV
jgi:hypothetical protein